jgi:hypothetical protein
MRIYVQKVFVDVYKSCKSVLFTELAGTLFLLLFPIDWPVFFKVIERQPTKPVIGFPEIS